MKIASSGAGSFLEPVSFRVNKPLEVIHDVSGRHYSGPKQWFWLLHHQSPWLHFSSGTLSLEISHAPSLHFDKNLINCPHCNIYKPISLKWRHTVDLWHMSRPVLQTTKTTFLAFQSKQTHIPSLSNATLQLFMTKLSRGEKQTTKNSNIVSPVQWRSLQKNMLSEVRCNWQW